MTRAAVDLSSTPGPAPAEIDASLRREVDELWGVHVLRSSCSGLLTTIHVGSLVRDDRMFGFLDVEHLVHVRTFIS